MQVGPRGEKWLRSCALVCPGNAGRGAGVDACVTKNGDEIREQTRFLREQAERCRRLADATTDTDIARRLLQLAREFEEQAAKLENDGGA